jgi:hypothetical protein
MAVEQAEALQAAHRILVIVQNSYFHVSCFQLTFHT